MTCTPGDVRDITGSTLDDPAIDPFILDAECIIDEAAECVTVTDACKDRACVNLSAHYLVTSNVGKESSGVKREKLEDVYDVEYFGGGQKGEGYLSTGFGTKANALMKGSLVELEKPEPSLAAIGTIC